MSESPAKTVPKWKQLQIEQEELAARRKREEAEAKAKKLQDELALSPDTALAAVRVAGGNTPVASPHSKGAAAASPAAASSDSGVPKWKQLQLENEKRASERKQQELEAKNKLVADTLKTAENPAGPSGHVRLNLSGRDVRGNNAKSNAVASPSKASEPAATAAASPKPASIAVPPSLRAPPVPADLSPPETSTTQTTTTTPTPTSTTPTTTTENIASPAPVERAVSSSNVVMSASDAGAEDEVVEAAMVEVVSMYSGMDDDEEGRAEAREEGGSDSESGGSDGSDDSDASGSEADLRRPPKDVSDAGLVPVMPRAACTAAASSVTPRDIVQSPSMRFRIGYAETQGVRRSMEDRMTIFGRLFGCDTVDYFGMFDGHGGDATAHHVGETLHNVLYDHIKRTVAAGSDDVTLNFALALDDVAGLRRAFTTAFESLQSSLEARQPPLAGGAVGVAALVAGDLLFVANCGDARAVLITANGGARRLTLDHKPHLPEEKSRIESLGGFVTTHTSRQGVITSRVCGAISVARAFGDIGLQPYLIATPFVAEPVSIVASNDGDGPVALLLACDGLFDVITDEQAGKIIVENPNPEKAAIKLRNAAYAGGSTDNISVMVIHLPAFVAKHPSQIEAQLASAHGD